MGSLLQGAAGLIVFGGTLGAVLLSFSVARPAARRSPACATSFVDDAPPPEDVVAPLAASR